MEWVLEANQKNCRINYLGKGINRSSEIYNCLNNENKIDNTLHVIIVISNVCEFKRRWELCKTFIEKYKNTKNIILYIVELIYENQQFVITEKGNPQHLQLKTKYALWHKENLINLGIKKLLPSNWKAVAWIDADIEFTKNTWVDETLKLLTSFDIIQLFDECNELDVNGNIYLTHTSFGNSYCNGKIYKKNKKKKEWDCGYAWACTRFFYDQINGLYDKSIVGDGDLILSQVLLGNIPFYEKGHIFYNYRKDIRKFYDNIVCNDIKIGYLPFNIKHFFHGKKENRKYGERNNILIKLKFDPNIHITYNNDGLLIPTEYMPIDILEEIYNYFKNRNEDEYYDLIKN